jgi:hypothetical protein
MKNLSQDSRCFVQDSSWEPPKYKHETLPLESTFFVDNILRDYYSKEMERPWVKSDGHMWYIAWNCKPTRGLQGDAEKGILRLVQAVSCFIHEAKMKNSFFM